MSQYTPKPDAEGINSPAEGSRLKDVCILLTGFLSIVAVFYFVLIAASDWALGRISLRTETRLLNSIWRANENDPKLPADIQKLADRLTPFTEVPVRFNLNCSAEINAFALPGGRVQLTRGLLENLKTENGLMFVMGHELGHIVHRDHLRGMGRQVIAALGAAVFGWNEMGGLSAVNNLVMQAFSREQEAAADEFGMSVLQKIYGHSAGAEELFEILSSKEDKLIQALLKFSSTHPGIQERITAIRLSQSKNGRASTILTTTSREQDLGVACK
jgi:Zn-dependent protease with chaperone function